MKAGRKKKANQPSKWFMMTALAAAALVDECRRRTADVGTTPAGTPALVILRH